ncbi:MAG: HEAT repeat domain-containing protein [Myxococcota bacterium]|nr:HEAT repeat domain-containing protein [Myxococcota bacterium]
MGIKDLFSVFSADARKEKAFDKMRSKLVSRNHQHDDRMWCIQQLAEMDSVEGTRALFRRWDMVADKKREDITEKEYLADVLAEKGPTILPQLQEHNDRSVNVTRPIQVLQRVVEAEEVVTELLRVLKNENERLASFRPEKKLRLIQLLSDYGDDPRLTAGVVPCIADFDADVRFEAAVLLGKAGTEQCRDALLDRLCSPEEESERVRQAILTALADRGFEVLSAKEQITPLLGDQWRIGPRGSLIAAD